MNYFLHHKAFNAVGWVAPALHEPLTGVYSVCTTTLCCMPESKMGWEDGTYHHMM